ncbi:hypothetical protein BTN33_08740 [Aeromonas veronii]|nr:hypothetical protein BTN33_08740 [Aeromonas veronii]
MATNEIAQTGLSSLPPVIYYSEQLFRYHSATLPCAEPEKPARGGRCGKRSAWSRAGGYAPICYKEEITDEMVSEWRGRAAR